MRHPILVAMAVMASWLAGCGDDASAVRVLRPHFAALLEVPGLGGEVIVYRGGTEIGRSSLVAEGREATARLPALPTGRDLSIELVWSAAGTVVARSAEAQTVRLKAGGTTRVEFPPDAYTYPDDDGDGASNITEVAWELSNPEAGEGAVLDPDVTPPGYLRGLIGTLAAPGYATGAHFLPGTENLVTCSYEYDREVDGLPTFKDHTVNLIHFGTGYRQSAPVDCAGLGWVYDLEVNPKTDARQVAVVCERQVFLYWIGASEPELQTRVAMANPGGILTYGAKGDRLYVSQIDAQRVEVIDVDRSSPDFGTLVDSLKAPLLQEGAQPVEVADMDGKLLILDGENGGLDVVWEDAQSTRRVEHVLAESLPDPRLIAVHPSSERIYVAEASSASLIVIDSGAQTPGEWEIREQVPIGGLFTDFAVEPIHGNWLYVLTDTALFRLDTLSNTIGWQQVFSESGDLTLASIDIDSTGTRGAICATAARGLALLGAADPKHREREPNNGLSDLDGQANVLGPLPARRAGFCDVPEDGALSYDYWAMAQGAPLDFTDDVEDLWLLEPGEYQGRVAIGVFATDSRDRLAVTLFDDGGELLDFAAFPMQGEPLAPGTGTFLITEPIPMLPSPLVVGAALQDLDHAYSVGPYEIIALPVPDPVPVMQESEPNNGAGEAQIVVSFPVEIHGTAEADDEGLHIGFGTEDVEDCFALRTSGNRLALRLDFDPDVDLDLIVLDENGDRIAQQYGLWGPGQTEYFAFEPHRTIPGRDYMACVVKTDSELPADSTYTLTIVDFEL